MTRDHTATAELPSPLARLGGGTLAALAYLGGLGVLAASAVRHWGRPRGLAAMAFQMRPTIASRLG